MRIYLFESRVLAQLVPLFFLATPSLVAQISFDYDRTRSLELREESHREQAGALLREISYAKVDGSWNGATIVAPKSSVGLRPGLLFVHWYGPPAPTSNRTQFIPDAIGLAKEGALSLLIDTPWSRPEYFEERTRAGDYDRSVRQVKELRRALDLLLSQPKVDPRRVAYVGHDFGAMYGALAAAADSRIRAFVFMAGTQSFSDWFLYGQPRLEGEARQKFVDELAPLDPIRYLPKLEIPILLQFAENDIHVPKARADALVAAATEPKEVRFYRAEHELNEQATRERIAWLIKILEIEAASGPTSESAAAE